MTEKKNKSVWAPILPVPEGTPPARVSHANRGEPLQTFVYNDQAGRLLGYACRFISSTGEALHLPLTWCQDQDGVRGWRWIQFQRLRPIYGLEELDFSGEPNDILVCFDEHAAWHARKLVPWLKAVSWPGGARNIEEVDWSLLRGSRVWIWPTLHRARAKQRRDVEEGAGQVLPRDRQPGWQASLKLERVLTGYGCSVFAIVDPWGDESRPEGWDAGMAGMQDWTPDQTTEWVMAHLARGMGTEAQQRLRKLKGEGAADAPPAGAELASTPSEAGAGSVEKDVWIPDLVYKNGDLSACLSNVFQILSNRPEWRGVVALDEFALKVVKRKPPPYPGGQVGEWGDTDDARTAMLLQRQYGFTPSSALIHEAVAVLADSNRVHPVREWLAGLVWDGTPRLDSWLVDHVGADDSEYVRLASKWWLMGAVQRVLRPGCKFDYSLVLEGEQGKKKSSAFDVLGGAWFGDTDLDFSNKDSMLALQGKLIYEIPELGALARSDERRQKSFLSRRFDEFRPPYGRGFVKVPRQMVFCGTTNEWEWNKDPTGGRRFWPVACKAEEINIVGLAEVREQLFAEAYALVMAGERYWPTAEEQKRLFDPEQLKVEQPDALVDALHDWVYARTGLFSLADAAMDGLKMDASKLTRDLQTRLGISLRKLGCSRVERRNGMTRFWYKPPEREVATSTDQSAQRGEEVSHVPF